MSRFRQSCACTSCRRSTRLCYRARWSSAPRLLGGGPRAGRAAQGAAANHDQRDTCHLGHDRPHPCCQARPCGVAGKSDDQTVGSASGVTAPRPRLPPPRSPATTSGDHEWHVENGDRHEKHDQRGAERRITEMLRSARRQRSPRSGIRACVGPTTVPVCALHSLRDRCRVRLRTGTLWIGRVLTRSLLAIHRVGSGRRPLRPRRPPAQPRHARNLGVCDRHDQLRSCSQSRAQR